MMRLVDFEPEHLDWVEQRDCDYIDGPGFAVQLANKTTYALTLFDGDEAIAIFGLCMPYPGVGYAWARVTDRARGKGVGLTKAAREALVRAGVTLPLRQIRAEVERSKPEYMRWAYGLGFRAESIKKGAAPDGGDLVEYVKWTAAAAAGEDSLRHLRSTTARCGRTTRNGYPMSKRLALVS